MQTQTLAALLVFAGAAALLTAPTHSFAQFARFEIVARDGELHPAQLQVPAGAKLKLTLRNEGGAPVEFENLRLRIEKVVAPRSAATVTVQPLAPGKYPVIDEFHPDTHPMHIIAQ